jgi:hypothetical protein
MAQNKGTKMLKVVLIIFAIVVLIYGLGYLFIPGVFVTLYGSESMDLSWIRWSGGPLIALGIGAILVFRNPSKQKIFVTTVALGSLITGLGLLYSLLIREYSGSTLSTLIPTVIALVLSGLLWWSRKLAKEILKAG